MSPKNFLFNFLISKIYRAFLPMNIKYIPLEIKDSDKCLCLAPHPDDESIGMGGTLIKYGKNFDLICMTNGSAGVIKEVPHEKRVEKRKIEFDEAMKKLNLNSSAFHEQIEDRELILHPEQFNKTEIADYDYIFVPNIIDQHRDHKAVSILLNELIKHKKHKKNLKIVFYEVWQTLAIPNFYIDISDVIEQKTDLIETYKSQICANDYTKILGLNSYRGLSTNLAAAEAFCVMDTKIFKKICKIYSF